MSSKTPLSDSLTIQEKLLLSQAVYKLGAFSWAEVSSLLLDHPCIKDATPHARPAKLFTPERCEGIYKELMGVIGINVPAPDGIKPHAKSHLRLAQNFYIARLTELQNEISSYETQFTSLMSEITALKKGELDGQLREEIKAGLQRKYGKKAVEEWMPGKAEIQRAVEDGPVKEREMDAVGPEFAKKEKEKEEKQKDVEEQGKDVEMVDASTSEETPAVSVLEKQDGPTKSSKPDTVEAKVEKLVEQVKTPKAARTTTSPQPSPLSPAPSDYSSVRSAKSAAEEKEEEDMEEEGGKEEEKEEGGVVPEKKSNKRKAVAQPKGAPPTKRSSRRGAVTEEPEVSEAEEAEEEEEEAVEEKEEEPPIARGRRSKRSSLTKPSASPSVPPKDISPTISRRAPSVSSTASAATPGGEGERRSSRRAAVAAAGRRGMRDDVVSKSVRGQTADAADAEDGPPTPTAAEDHEPETRKSTRASRRKSGHPEHQQQTAATPTPVERERRGTRATTRIPRLGLRESVENEQELASVNNGDENNDHDDDYTTNNNNDEVENSDPNAPIAPVPSNNNKGKGKKSSKPFLFSLLETIASHRFGTIFESPVRKSDAPDYYSVIKRPMDLKTIKGKIKEGRIERIDELERDVLLMFSNAMMYNASDSQVYEMAKEMMKDCEGHFAHFRNMELELDKEG
ncbi:bromodomain-containing protein 8 [Cryptococcus bacillisporus CA1873]|uniref:Bromodomain-containing protein 8 n=1 Tax=Cryptococcus bacillisporus CA1873 TaxID=1296111 RepID=A0ABR5BAM9_CRYGA|nr:bromodomain-containing protein 8 [Cryptococcus bacillisporus CA1873]|eukprot:KIR62430.1 bromodomain-containing protein 8 [Cryptococcus gattii CA1873]